MQAPGSVNAQSGSGKTGLGMGKSKSAGGSNQGKVGGQTPRYSAHPRMKGQ
jgi:hypothetical protein